MVVFPNCKINIGLQITGKRPDGYHNVESVMIPVGWSDVLEIVERDKKKPDESQLTGSAVSGKARFFSYGIPIPGEATTNLCLKVYHLLEEWFNLPEIDIHLLKVVPIGAGLGGGSSDAAFCLRALKDYFSLSISDKEAKKLLSKIGSDCPFFWNNQPAFAFGKGDELRKLDLDLNGKWIILVYPNFAISTAEAYSGVSPKPSSIDLSLLPNLPIYSWKGAVANDFENHLLSKYDELSAIKQTLYAKGAVYASMSGSGSTMYGIFNEKPELDPSWSTYKTFIGEL